jgi:hypothetical protein
MRAAARRPTVLYFLVGAGAVRFLAGFFAGAFLGAGAVAGPLGLIKFSTSSALNGYVRSEVCPVVVSDVSTRRLTAKATTLAFLTIRAF